MSQSIESVDELKRKLELQRKALDETHRLIEGMEREAISKRREKYRPAAQLAHDLLCPYNHTDGCGWHYEGDEWGADAHDRWLRNIEKVVENSNLSSHYYHGFTFEKLVQLLNMLADMKKVDPRAISILQGIR